MDVPICEDSTREPNETVTVQASMAVDFSADLKSATATINNDDGIAFSVNDVSAVEGTSGGGNTTFTFTVTKDGGGAGNVSYATSAGGTATAGACGTLGVDYQTVSTTLFPSGGFATDETTKTFTVSVCKDSTPEADETFNVSLSGASASSPNSASISDATGLGTIQNDDFLTPSVTLTIHDSSHNPVTSVGAASTVHPSVMVTGSSTTPTGNVTFTFYQGNGCGNGAVIATSGSLALVGGSKDATAFLTEFAHRRQPLQLPSPLRRRRDLRRSRLQLSGTRCHRRERDAGGHGWSRHVQWGTSKSYSASWTDADSGQTHTCTIDFGDGGGPVAGTMSPAQPSASGTCSASHTYADGPNSYTIAVSVNDGAETGSNTATATVNNVAPMATFGNNGPVDEGSDIVLSLTVPSDPLSVDTTAGFTYAFDCGSGYGAFAAATTANCPTDDSGTRSVKGKIKDKDNGVNEYTASVTIDNVAPTIDLQRGRDDQ